MLIKILKLIEDVSSKLENSIVDEFHTLLPINGNKEIQLWKCHQILDSLFLIVKLVCYTLILLV